MSDWSASPVTEEGSLADSAAVLEIGASRTAVQQSVSDNVAGNASELEEAKLLSEEGTRAFALRDYELAIAKFGQATEIIGNTYGQESWQYADCLVRYGRALLENSRSQNSVLGNEAIEKQVETDVESEDTFVGNTTHLFFEGEPNFEDDAGSDTEEADGDEQRVGEASDEQEQVDDLAVAWESLDAARVIYSRVDTDNAQIVLGDLYLLLGDVSLENETFDQAVADFRQGLSIKSKRLTEDDRQLAEAHYKLALALEFSTNERHHAVDHVQQAIGVLQRRKATLNLRLATIQEQQSGKGKGIATPDNDVETIEKEIKEINELLSEMDSKVEDLKSPKAPVASAADAALDELMQFAAASSATAASLSSMASSSSSALPVNDVTPLIKRKANANSESLLTSDDGKKRKSEEDAELDSNESEPKKHKI